MDGFLWGDLKDKVYAAEPPTVSELKQEIERQCLAVPNDLICNVLESIGRRCQMCLENGVVNLNICEHAGMNRLDWGWGVGGSKFFFNFMKYIFYLNH